MAAPPTDNDSKGVDVRVGTTLADRYRIDRLVDTGAMGRVYLGEHVLMRKRVAIKVLHRSLSNVPEFVRRFEREAMAAANIDNEHVVTATDFGKLSDGAVFLVLEFVEGRNLRDEIENGPMPAERALGIAYQIALALSSAHALGIVHRDLKPENVMLIEKPGNPDFVKVLDFGIAKVPLDADSEAPSSSRPVTKAGVVIGTPEYMPPEQALGQDVDHRADIYSLGVILYEMLAGVRPFDVDGDVGVLGQQLAVTAPAFAVRAPQVSVHPGVERFVMKMLERDASNRFQSAEELLAHADRLVGNPKGRTRLLTLKEGTGIGLSEAPLPIAESRPSSLDGQVSSPSFGPVGRWIDRYRRYLPAPLRTLPAPVLVALPLAAGSVVLGFVIVGALGTPTEVSEHDGAGAGSPSASAAESPASSGSAGSAPASSPSASIPVPAGAKEGQAPEAELVMAISQGVTALSSLGEKYPRDAGVLIALGGLHLREKNLPAAVEAIARAIAIDPELRRDKQVSSVLWVASQNKKSSEAAFRLLEGPMGDRGREILNDLVTTPGVRQDVKARAQQVLKGR